MLACSLARIRALREKLTEGKDAGDFWRESCERIESDTRDFCLRAKQLLLEEKMAAREGTLSKLGKVNERVDSLRGLLFGKGMNHGGLCRVLFDRIDRMLLDLLRLE